MPQINKIKIRRGLNASLPAGGTEAGELRYSTNTKELYIDDGASNVKIGGNPADFPVSTAQQTALDAKADLVAGKIPSGQLPSYVDDVLEYANLAAFPATGETGKIYVAVNAATAADPTLQYRWTGTVYAVISPSPGSTDYVPEGPTNKYFSESRVLDTILAGISFASSLAVTAADSIKQAIGKLQAQITDANTAIAGKTTAATLAAQGGAALVGNTPAGNIAAITVQAAVNELDTEKAAKAGGDFSGPITVPAGATGTQVPQAQETYQKGSILGAVGQTGGVPTGSIIETGTNANGTYTKWADGTMICTKSVATGVVAHPASGALYKSAAVSAGAWAANFANTPHTSFGGTNTAGGGWIAQEVYPNAVNAGSYSSVHCLAGSAGWSMWIIAVGRWF